MPNVNLKRYLGKWYEIESFPAWFQKGCKDTTAEYTEMGSFIQVKNTCTKNGERKEKIGKAFTTQQSDLLRVQFFFPFRADYKIEYIDKEYRHAVVGSGNKGYLWILSRTKKLPPQTLDKLRGIAKQKGYDISRLEKSH